MYLQTDIFNNALEFIFLVRILNSFKNKSNKNSNNSKILKLNLK